MKINIFCFVICVSVFASCSDDTPKDKRPVGKWMLTETYDGYADGGTYSWTPQSDQHTKILIFSAEGVFVQEEYTPDLTRICTGNYSVNKDNILTIESSCNEGPYEMRISQFSNTTLVIDHQVFEGVIKNKYRYVTGQDNK